MLFEALVYMIQYYVILIGHIFSYVLIEGAWPLTFISQLFIYSFFYLLLPSFSSFYLIISTIFQIISLMVR